jgi:NAD(P)H-hydrate epimerase
MKDLPPLLEPLWDAAQMRAADSWTIQSLGVRGGILMDHAGRAVADAAEAMASDGPVLVLAGPGNNGGDGWVAARHLFGRGIPAPIVALREPEELDGDAHEAAQMFVRAADSLGWQAPDGGPAWRLLEDVDDLEALVTHLRPALVIDALFGTGLARPLEGLGGEVVAALGWTDVPLLAVDLPSGLPTDGAAPDGPCLKASRTVTFGGRKIAHASEPGRFLCGDVENVDIGILRDDSLRSGAWCFAAPALGRMLAEPAVDAHKGRFGHVGVVEGAPETAGAARLAARAALRAGAGLCTLLVDDPERDAGLGMPELMRRRAVPDLLDGVTALAIGPGLGTDEDAKEKGLLLLRAAVERELPVVVDADALPLLREDGLERVRAIATPHPGEAARLLDMTPAEVQADRPGACEKLLAVHGDVVWVLKGACPLVSLPDGRLIVHEGGAPALAIAGSGDVLAGAIAAFLAAGHGLAPAAVAGVAAHQAAGEQAGARGLLASEIADALALVLAEARADG